MVRTNASDCIRTLTTCKLDVLKGTLYHVNQLKHVAFSKVDHLCGSWIPQKGNHTLRCNGTMSLQRTPTTQDPFNKIPAPAAPPFSLSVCSTNSYANLGGPSSVHVNKPYVHERGEFQNVYTAQYAIQNPSVLFAKHLSDPTHTVRHRWVPSNSRSGVPDSNPLKYRPVAHLRKGHFRNRRLIVSIFTIFFLLSSSSDLVKN